MNLNGLAVWTRRTALPVLIVLLTAGVAFGVSAAGNVFEYDNGWWFSSMNAEATRSGTAESGGATNKTSSSVDLTTTVEVSHWILVDNKGLRQDWRPSAPGMYASDAVTLIIESNEDVAMDFAAEATAAAPGATNPEQWFLFTTSALPSWDEAAWLADNEMNEPHIASPGYNAQAGSQQYTLWEKARLDGRAWEQHRSVTLAIINVRVWVDPSVQKYMSAATQVY